MDLGIKQRIALISGGDSGMGKETARQLLEAGVRVAITESLAEAGGAVQRQVKSKRSTNNI